MDDPREREWDEVCRSRVGTCAICPKCGGSSTSFCQCAKERFFRNYQYQVPKKSKPNQSSADRFGQAVRKLMELSGSIDSRIAWKSWKYIDSVKSTDSALFDQLVESFESLVNDLAEPSK